MAAIGATAVALVLTIMLLLAALATTLLEQFLGIPYALQEPLLLRAVGAAAVLVGLAFLAWSIRARRPADVVLSTWATLRKLLGSERIEELAGRTEPFVPKGPYRYVRNPMYFGVTAALLGGGVFLGSPTILAWGLLMAAWFWVYLIPFEEKELAALFGESYQEYARRVPKMLPYGRRYEKES